jgi:UDP:flavonoid glycosyltransferase YjiC (YdhE family)
MARFVIATWDGAGNLVPTLGIARALVERGHDVRMIGHRSIAERCGDQGTRFISLPQPEGWDAMDEPDNTEAEIALMIDTLCFSDSIAETVATELSREPADVVLVDCMLWTALDVALASGAATANLVHTPYTLFRGGPLIDMFTPGIERLNAHRPKLGLPAVTHLTEPHDACDLTLVAVPKEFEPDVSDAPNVVRIGPVLDAPALSREIDDVDLTDGATPLVLVSLSTSEQGQLPLLRRIVDAVATLPVRAIVTTGPEIDPGSVTSGANTQVVRYVPHSDVLPATSLVITHAGLGTTMASLARGVPLLCTPLGRDQFFNAECVVAMGAGRALMPDADTDAIAAAATSILGDDEIRAGAKRAAVTFANYGGTTAAVAELESLASRT